jgi:hypothetical protein
MIRMASGDSYYELSPTRLSGTYKATLTYLAAGMNWTARFFRRKNPDEWGYFNETNRQWYNYIVPLPSLAVVNMQVVHVLCPVYFMARHDSTF